MQISQSRIPAKNKLKQREKIVSKLVAVMVASLSYGDGEEQQNRHNLPTIMEMK